MPVPRGDAVEGAHGLSFDSRAKAYAAAHKLSRVCSLGVGQGASFRVERVSCFEQPALCSGSIRGSDTHRPVFAKPRREGETAWAVDGTRFWGYGSFGL